MEPFGGEEREASWPADAHSIQAARVFLSRTCGQRTVIACDSDVDGLASAVLVERAVAAAGGRPCTLPARRGEHVHTTSMQTRIGALEPGCLIVLDMGSRPHRILPRVPTLVIDHHHAAAGGPPDAVVVNGYDKPPVAPTSVLAYVVCATWSDSDRDSWLAALGAIADLGSASAFAALLGIRAGGVHWTRAVSLLNAARRAAQPDAVVALAALRRAGSVGDISSGRVPEAEQLKRMQAQVRAEVDRCARVPPTIVNDVAFIRFSSGAQVHPIIATRWARRLRPRVVIAANDGYLPQRTNFAVRCAADLDLVRWLRSLPFTPSRDAEYAHGHARATGGSLSPADFSALLDALGVSAAAPRPSGIPQ